MAIQHEVAGPCLLKYQTSPASLGYSRDGFTIRFDPRFIEVPSDDFGGQSGAPSDVQIVGGSVSVTGDLTKYDKAEVHKLTAFAGGGTAFTLPAYGTLLRQSTTGMVALTIDGVAEDWTFSKAYPKACELNKGTRFTTAQVGFEAHVDAAATRVLATLA